MSEIKPGAGDSENDQMEETNREVQCTFHTNLPDDFQVDNSLEIQLNTSSTNKDLTQVLRGLVDELQDDLTEQATKDLKSKKIQFMVNNVFLTTTLQDLMDKLNL